MEPSARYQQDIDDGKITPDPAQSAVLRQCDRLCQELQSRYLHENRLINRALSRFMNRIPLDGVYIYGSVGAGKTYIMDLFYHSLPFAKKKRVHFYQFLQMLYAELKKQEGQKDPLKQIAKNLSQRYLVLCFDEVTVTDIGDAMLLGNVFNALFDEGLTLVATSNLHPDDLYKGGLQRDLFLPAINAIKRYTEVIALTSQMDYRLRALTDAGIYFSPLNQDAEQAMQTLFDLFSHGAEATKKDLVILGRSIRIKAKVNAVVWFDFYDLCDIPRAPADYLALAQLFETVFVSDVPKFNEKQTDLARNFISVVDVFYDHKIKLVLSAQTEVLDLYPKTGALAFAFDRSCSRLIEMQSADYLKMK